MNSLIFATKKQALEFLKAIDDLDSNMSETSFSPNGTYYLSHGEYSRPDYTPRRYKAGWSIHVTYYFYPGTCYAPQDGKVDPEEFYNDFLQNNK